MIFSRPSCMKMLPSIIISIGILSFLSFSNAYAHNNDPLTVDEISRVGNLVTPQTLAAKSEGGVTVNDNQELLLIERNEEKGAPKDQRRADVYIYNYSTDELEQSLVDLNTSEIISTVTKQGVQLPLTVNELKRAKEIVFEDEDERQILEHEYNRITSRTLNDTSELNIKAFTFTADSLPNRVNEASKQCGIHRCAQLMLYTDENIVFEISPIVNLSAGVVTQRIGF
ncbi:hypothetical protein OO007_03835 [Cocleimonas sp. KMM 6892]|uniref:hypothetical protein n=1 Tax=unclassified Cocleimonas TaxID=2639732 RepID=UPI002DB59EBF|nr:MULTISPECIES: hypothetical protein [unclassified Cocleimonas]MEB8431345.1 hypothetical protein [Cocleimonas sp. KMM 6892]MEC4713883.1 hypothetical protein [Cocleimonas sp. KMM 6895]MEC4743214.1 hypothetical protein [Cocleimonas sp. KMM 6896]